MSKQFWAVIGILVLIFGGIYFIGGRDSADTASTANVKPTSHIKGNNTTGVTLLEYGDFQCNGCFQYEPTVQEVFKKYEDRIAFQFRHFPLTNAHPNAFAAARAAEAAGMQDKFFEMHDKLFDPATYASWTQTTGPTPVFEQFASQIGLNVAEFRKDYASTEVNNRVNADMREGNKAGVDATPTFFINGKKVQINNSVEAFSKVIDAEIAKNKPGTDSATEATRPADDSAGATEPAQGSAAE